MGSGCEIIIGDYVTLNRNVVIEASSGGRIKIGDKCLCSKESKIAIPKRGEGKIEIGNYVTTGERFFLHEY